MTSTTPSSAMATASRLVLFWLLISTAGAFFCGLLPLSVAHIPGLSLVVLAFHLACLTVITDYGVARIALPEVSQWRRWVILGLGFGLVSVSFLAIRGGAPFRSTWEAVTTCGQILVVVVAAGYLPKFLKSPAEILPLVSVMICADVVSFLVGPTHVIARDVAEYYQAGRQGLYPVSEILLMKFATPATEDLYPLFGLADWFMVVFLSEGIRHFNLSDRVKGVPLAVAGLFIASAAAQLFNIFLPALPVLATFFIISMVAMHPEAMRPQKREVALLLFPPLLSASILLVKL